MRRDILTAAIGMLAAPALAQAPLPLRVGAAVERPLAPGGVEEASVRLRAGESADAVVRQQGIDVVVELRAPGGRLLATIDSPNGRQGDEPVPILAETGGVYRLTIRPIAANEPAGRISIELLALRDRAATRAAAEARRRARDAAAAWLAGRSAVIPGSGTFAEDTDLAPFDRIASEAQIVGLGEATHGSRELNDARLSLVKRLVERHGYRLIALEDSAARWRALAPYVAGESASPESALEWGWIGRRARRALLDWVRARNLAHPDDRVRIVGVDPQDANGAYAPIGDFLGRAYGEPAGAAWAPWAAELAAADRQTLVFGNSDTSPGLRQASLELLARIEGDAPLLRRRFPAAEVDTMLAAARDIAQFVDFNAGTGWLAHNRDWYMAANLIAEIDRAGGRVKAIYWGHNAHVSAAGNSAGGRLRGALGCFYRAVATSFGEGGFIAQLPNDAEDRLVASTLQAGTGESIEALFAGPQARLAAWSCAAGDADMPEWLREPRRLRWIGGLYTPGSPPENGYRLFRLTQAFDGIVYLPRVGPEEIPTDRPIIPARR